MFTSLSYSHAPTHPQHAWLQYTGFQACIPWKIYETCWVNFSEGKQDVLNNFCFLIYFFFMHRNAHTHTHRPIKFKKTKQKNSTCCAVGTPSVLGITCMPPSICWITPASRRADSDTSSPNDLTCWTAFNIELRTFSASVSNRQC